MVPRIPSPVAGTIPIELARHRLDDERPTGTGDGASRQYLARPAYPLGRAMNKLHEASLRGHTEVVQLLLDKGAPVDEKTESGRTALMWASNNGHTEVVKLLLDKGASVNEKDKEGSTALMGASQYGRTGVVVLLLDNGASVDEKDEDGYTALLRASWKGHTEVVKLLLDKGASVGVKNNDGKTVLPTVIAFDEDQLGRMAAAQLHRLLPQGQSTDLVHAEEVEEEVFLEERTAFAEATGTAVLQLARLAGFARARARALRSSDPRSADDHQALFGRLQLAAAASIQNDESGEARYEEDVQKLFNSKDGRKALEHAVEIEAKELLAQPVVQKYIKVAWHGPFDMEDPELELLQWVLAFVFLLLNLLGVPPTLVDRVSGVLQWAFFFVLLLLQLLFLLPLVALVPALEPWLTKKLRGAYLLRLPVVKFGLACAADLTLALALTFLPAADLATAPVAQLLLVWVGSGLLWEARQLMAPSSSDARLLLTRVYDRLVAYLGDYINRVDATALIFSFAALVAFMSADDSEDATATSLRAVAVFLLWLRVIRALLVSPQFGPYVLMFFRMLCNDVLYFLVLLLFLLVAFAASWTVLLGPSASIAGCADELGGVDFHTTLLRIFEGALTGNDYFDCARNSTNSPVAAWVVTFAYVTLTAVLLLNMLIAMCAALPQPTAQPSASADLIYIYYLPRS
eukprot:scaffold39231_cov60-Phaeocystis_antarctica.AAC.2